MLRLDQFLPCRERRVQVLDRDTSLEVTAEPGLDPDGVGKAVFSAVRLFLFLHGFHSPVIRKGLPSPIHDSRNSGHRPSAVPA